MSILAVLSYPDIGPWQIGPLEFPVFGVLMCLGFFIGILASAHRGARTMGVAEERVQNYALWILFVGLAVSNVFAVVTYNPDVFMEVVTTLPSDAGTAMSMWPWTTISSVGGALGALIGGLIWIKFNPAADHLAWANLSFWTMPIGFVFGRLGCAAIFDHPGKEPGEIGVWTWLHEATGERLPELFPLLMEVPDHMGGGIRHNMGLYDAIVWGVIVVAFIVLSRKPRRRGLYMWLLPLLYTPARFVLDFMRATPEAVPFGGDPRYLGLTPAQYMCIAFFALGLYGWYRLKDAPVEQWRVHEDVETE